MGLTRRFIIAPSFARLIRREKGSRRILEGHFRPSRDRQSHVIVDSKCRLVLITRGPDGEMEEEHSEVPLRQAHFLLEVCAGTVIYERSRLQIDGQAVWLDSYSKPASFAVAELEFETDATAAAFQVPPWFGPEVTSVSGYDRQSIAIETTPSAVEVPISDEGLDALLDVLDRAGRDRSRNALQSLGPAANSQDGPDSPNAIEPVLAAEAL